ncbi:MAG: GIY-YIG nuclease family protein [Desulfobacteraceae bacterium]|nr:GIY-YIG nuclease family protein [Desulfobacteraceae bacterium]
MIYFIQQGEDGPIKIGYTDDEDAQRRLSQLQTGTHHKLHILTTIEGNKLYETELHERFEGLKLSGEWFKPSETLLNYIENPPRLRQDMLRYKNFSLEKTIDDLKNQNRELQEDLNKLKKAYKTLTINYNRLLRSPDKMGLELQTFIDENRDLKQEIEILQRKLRNWTPPKRR